MPCYRWTARQRWPSLDPSGPDRRRRPVTPAVVATAGGRAAVKAEAVARTPADPALAPMIGRTRPLDRHSYTLALGASAPAATAGAQPGAAQRKTRLQAADNPLAGPETTNNGGAE